MLLSVKNCFPVLTFMRKMCIFNANNSNWLKMFLRLSHWDHKSPLRGLLWLLCTVVFYPYRIKHGAHFVIQLAWTLRWMVLLTTFHSLCAVIVAELGKALIKLWWKLQFMCGTQYLKQITSNLLVSAVYVTIHESLFGLVNYRHSFPPHYYWYKAISIVKWHKKGQF